MTKGERIIRELKRQPSYVGAHESAYEYIRSVEAALQGVVNAYKQSVPFRTADVHMSICTCLRCAVDQAEDTLRSER